MSEAGQRTAESVVELAEPPDKTAKTLVFRVYRTYRFRFVQGKDGKMEMLGRWKEGAEGRVSSRDIWIPPQVYRDMLAMAYAVAKEHFRPDPIPEPTDGPRSDASGKSSAQPTNGMPPKPISDEERDQILFGERSSSLLERAEPRPDSDPSGYPCADFIPHRPRASTVSRKNDPQKVPYRRVASWRSHPPPSSIPA
ncbi:MAG: hypothetical protein LiPW15_581 [Parcubacteria group bacterium LiPW_15]|nr:MAG: hypothetical protein LiPW15_581 [Parcubacteria group bacterium LiPW_15]